MLSTRELTGRARRLGDDVNTDYIIASTRKRDTLDEKLLARYLLETLDPRFADSVRPGDILVAGRNFGCGSAMEIAVTVILAAGIRAVVAQSFARTFYRNAINNGLIPAECDTASIAEGDTITLRFGDDRGEVENARSGAVMVARPMPPFLHDILNAGGLVDYLRGRRAQSLRDSNTRVAPRGVV
ncbi:MAG TPA: 3-isopropylmalate dehydratase [Gemmatimonadaceae bacterium]|jgi:3-isopropylmalate/(R)-2-methylmalate dehydratase small subunit